MHTFQAMQQLLKNSSGGYDVRSPACGRFFGVGVVRGGSEKVMGGRIGLPKPFPKEMMKQFPFPQVLIQNWRCGRNVVVLLAGAVCMPFSG